jgi:hypothetical protein
MGLPVNPVRDCRQALTEQRDVETQFGGSQVRSFFQFRKKINQDGADLARVEYVSHVPVSGASPATAAPVGENHKAFGANRQSNVGREFNAIDGHSYGDVLDC